MGYIKTTRQGNSHAYRTGSLQLTAESFANRVQNYEAAITENRNGNDPAHKHQSQLGMFFAYATDNYICKTYGCPCTFQNQTN